MNSKSKIRNHIMWYQAMEMMNKEPDQQLDDFIHTFLLRSFIRQ